MQASFGRSLKRGIISAIAFAIPFLVAHYGTYANLTIGGVLTALAHYIEKKYIA